MAADKAIMEKIAKLLALAGNNPNEHEAAAAAAKAQAMLLEYDLSAEQVQARHDKRTAGIGEAERIVLRKKGKPGGWKVDLFAAVGETCDCVVYASPVTSWYDSTGYMVGRHQDLELAMYVYSFLTHELERLQDEYGKSRWAELREYARMNDMTTHEAEREFKWRGNHPLRAKDSWIRGAAEQVASTLWQEYRSRNQYADASALVVDKQQAIRDYQAQKAGYKDEADARAQRKARLDARPVVVEKPMSASQRRRQAAADERYWERRAAAQARADARKWANTDLRAYRDGQKTGRTIGVRPGVKA